MTPYASFTYFDFLLYPVIPAITAGLTGRLYRWAIMAATAIMILLQYGVVLDLDSSVSIRQFYMLLGYAVYEGALIKAFSLAKARKLPRWTGTVAVVLGVVPLVAVKVAPLAGGVLGFLGISYLTFRSLDVIFGIQDGLIREVRLPDLWLYLLFFPTIASGPIDRYRRFLKDIERLRTTAEYVKDLDSAVAHIFRGDQEPVINPEVHLYESGLIDSFGTVQLMVALESEFGTAFSPAEFDPAAWATPNLIVEIVRGRLGE